MITTLGFTLGSIIGIVMLVIAVILLSVGITLMVRYSKHLFTGMVLNAIGGLFIFIFAIVSFPYNPAYWNAYQVTGTIATIENSGATIDASGNSVVQNYAIEIEGLDDYFVSEDPRVLIVGEGNEVNLVCTLQWNYQAADTYYCSLGN